MHLGRLIKDVVNECDDPFTLMSEHRKMAVVLTNLGAYVTLRTEAFEAAKAGCQAEADEMHTRCCEMLETIRKG